MAKDGSTSSADQTKNESEKIFAGRFRYTKPLGKGAGGSVYLAEDLHNDHRKVALKVLPKDACESVQGKMLRREFEILSKLDHSHLVRVYDYGALPNGGIYLAEEYIDGFSLQDARALLAPEALIDITRQVLLGLSYLHGMGMIHRDVKPANVMLLWLDDASARPMVKLVDFGLSSMDPSRDTLRGGTRSYMAPEIIRGDKGELRSDLFSLGVTLYYALCGVLPFGPRSKKDPPPTDEDFRPPEPHRFNPEVPLTLSRFTMVLLRQVEGVEYQDAGEALQALSRDTKPFSWWSESTLGNSFDAAAGPVLRGYFERGILSRRKKDHEKLVDYLSDDERETGSLCVVRGEEGIGKSRLMRDVAATMKLKRRQVVTLKCDSGMRPWELLHHMIARVIDIGASRNLRKIERYKPYLSTLERLSRMEPEAAESVDYSWAWKAFDDAVRLLNPEKLVFFVQNLHLADGATQKFIAQWFGEERPERRPDLLATVVPRGRSGTLWEGESVDRFDVQGLTRADVESFFSGRLGLQDVPGEWLDEVTDRAAGRPRYLEELCRTMVDAGLLRRRSISSWEIDLEELKHFQLPAGLHASFRRRFVRVGATAREALEILALCDRPMRWETLRDYVVSEQESIEAADRSLQALRWRYLAKMNLEMSGRYMQLVDDDLRAVVLDLISPSWKRALHRRIGGRLYEEWRTGGQDPLEAGEHLEAGGREDEAGEMFEIAGDAQWNAGEYGEAQQHYRQALGLTDSGPARAYLQLKRARALLMLYEAKECRQVLEEAGTLADQTTSDWVMYNVWLGAAQLSLAMGDLSGVQQWLQRIGNRLPTLKQQTPVLEAAAELAYCRGDLKSAVKKLQMAIQRAAHFSETRGRVRAQGMLAEIECLTGRYQNGEGRFRQALDLADGLDDRSVSGELLCRLGTSMRRMGEVERGRRALEESLEILSRGSLPDRWIEVLLQLARCRHVLGDVEAARQYAEDALTFARQLDDDALTWRVEFLRAELMSESGGEEAHQEALAVMEDAVRGVRHAGTAMPELGEMILRLANSVARHDGAGADPLFRTGRKLIQTMGAKTLERAIPRDRRHSR